MTFNELHERFRANAEEARRQGYDHQRQGNERQARDAFRRAAVWHVAVMELAHCLADNREVTLEALPKMPADLLPAMSR